MKTLFKLTILALVLFVTSCKTENNIFVEYPMKDVVLSTQSLTTSVQTPILATMSAKSQSGNRLMNSGKPTTTSDHFDFPEYLHSVPKQFTAYFYAADGSDQGKLMYTFKDLEEGSHTITVQARPYVIVVSDFEANYGRDNNKHKLPENSADLYLFGETTADFSKTDQCTVLVENSYAAVLIYKNEVVKSVPQVNGFQFFESDQYYIGYLRDQNSNPTFNRNIQVSVLKRDGSVLPNYNINGTFTANKNHYYLFKTTATTEGGFNIVVQEDILKDKTEQVIITQ